MDISANLIEDDHALPSVNTMRKRFGSLVEAYRQAGIPWIDAGTSIANARKVWKAARAGV